MIDYDVYYLDRYCEVCGMMLNVEPVFISDTEHKWSVTCRECNSTFFIDGKYRIYTWAPNSDIVQEKTKKDENTKMKDSFHTK